MVEINKQRDDLKRERDQMWQQEVDHMNYQDRLMVEQDFQNIQNDKKHLLEKRKEKQQLDSFNLTNFNQQIHAKKLLKEYESQQRVRAGSQALSKSLGVARVRASTLGQAGGVVSGTKTNTVSFEVKGTQINNADDAYADNNLEHITDGMTNLEYDDLISSLFKTKPHPAIRRRERADKRVEHVKSKFPDHFEQKKEAATMSRIDQDYEQRLVATCEKLNREEEQRRKSNLTHKEYLLKQILDNKKQHQQQEQ